MASFLVVEHLDVIEQVGARFASVSIADAIDPFAFEQAGEALSPLGHRLGVLDNVRRRVDHAGDQHVVVRQGFSFPRSAAAYRAAATL